MNKHFQAKVNKLRVIVAGWFGALSCLCAGYFLYLFWSTGVFSWFFFMCSISNATVCSLVHNMTKETKTNGFREQALSCKSQER